MIDRGLSKVGVLGAIAGDVPYARVDGDESNRYDVRSLVTNSDGGDDSMPLEAENSGRAGLASTSPLSVTLRADFFFGVLGPCGC